MSAAEILVEQPQDHIVVSKAAPVQTTAVPQKERDREGFFIVLAAIVVAFTVTVAVIGSILIALALRGSGVMASLFTRLLQFSC